MCRIPIPTREFSLPPRFSIIRSFDVNRPGADIETLRGGVAGGTILQGCLRVGDEIEIRPGLVRRRAKTGRLSWTPIRSIITTLQADHNHLMYAITGGLLSVGTKVDPQLTRSDNMVGHMIGHPDAMPEVFIEIDVQTTILKRLIKTKDGVDAEIKDVKEGETLLINIGSTTCGGSLVSKKKDFARILLMKPVCTNINGKIALSRRLGREFRLIGWGTITRGYSKQSGS